MRNRSHVFPEEIKLSEPVLEKTDQAFAKVREEAAAGVKKIDRRRSAIFKAQAVAAAGICILGVSGISAAAIHHYWGRGMSGNIQASDVQQQELTESGTAKVYREEPDYASMAQTDHGITITPDTVVVDDRYAYLSFCISGYQVEDGAEPGFEKVEIYQGEQPEDAESGVNLFGSMYDGILADENGAPVYEDGAALEYREDGSIISRYTDEQGNMEYIIQASVADEEDSLLGKTIHVNFKNLGTLSKAAFTLEAEGAWDFELRLPDVSADQKIEVGKQVEGTDFTMESIELSPISIKVNYTVSEAPQEEEDELFIPEVKGVVLTDGTRLPYLVDGGMLGYTDDTRTEAYQIAGFDRVLTVDQVAALILSLPQESGSIELPIAP